MGKMTKGLWFTLLGPVRGWLDGTELELGSPDQRAVLAFLLLREGRPATVDEIIDALWGEDAPRSAQGVLRTYVYRLRRLFSGVLDGDPLIESVGASYALPTAGAAASGAAASGASGDGSSADGSSADGVSADARVVVDARVFQERIAEARRARGRGDAPGAAALLSEAFELWRGTPLSGVRGPYADRERQRLWQLHDEALEERFAADVDRGAHREVISALTQAVAGSPRRERLRELLMLALYRAGRQAEALDAYNEAEQMLDEQLGIAPGPALRELHGRILRADPDLELLARCDGAGRLLVPAQLPPDVPDFTGRAAEIAEITRVLSAAGSRAPVVALAGLGGMGKSALAVHVAHLLSGQFPGGQMYADLGAGRDIPADPAAVLAGFLRASGVPTEDIPPGLDERAALWRTVLAGRKMLIMLDDAADGEQVRHLLPAAAGSAGIVTSGRRLTGLPGPRWIRVDAMTSEDAVRLLARMVGEDRIGAEPGPASHLADACSCEPLALRMAAARLLDRPLSTVAQVAAQLDDDLTSPVVVHDDCLVVIEPLERAESRLDEATAAAFRLLAVPDSRSLTAPAAAAALELPENLALGALERLVDAYLLIVEPGGHYRYHGLVKSYARREARSKDGPSRCRAVLRRLADYYIASARAEIYSARTARLDGSPAGNAGLGNAGPAKEDILAVLAQTYGLQVD
jgi:DNA-binding SARP family transcriptional activator